ncbi:MAG: serine O-acetyltransferase [Herbaspirillum sp.]
MDKNMHVKELLTAQIDAAMWECCPPKVVRLIRETEVVDRILVQSIEDAMAFSAKDPAAGNDPLRVIQTYTSFKAMLHYRLAYAVDNLCTPAFLEAEPVSTYAALISSRGKLLSGAELHQKCRIGWRFVLDHGVGTVFGETAQIGDDCYVLGGVILGATGIAGNPSDKRHPTVGDKVQIGAFARVLGDVTVGSDVFIGAHCVITEDIAPFSRVSVRVPLQIVPIQHRQDDLSALAVQPSQSIAVRML